jgi:hypothetical protein
VDLYDFFFPEQAQAKHLRKIASNLSPQRLEFPMASPGESSDSSLRQDLNFLALVLTAILKRLDETKTLSIGDVKDLLNEVDGMDGVTDAGLPPNLLRGLLGAVDSNANVEGAVESEEDRSEFEIQTTPRYRK